MWKTCTTFAKLNHRKLKLTLLLSPTRTICRDIGKSNFFLLKHAKHCSTEWCLTTSTTIFDIFWHSLQIRTMTTENIGNRLPNTETFWRQCKLLFCSFPVLPICVTAANAHLHQLTCFSKLGNAKSFPAFQVSGFVKLFPTNHQRFRRLWLIGLVMEIMLSLLLLLLYKDWCGGGWIYRANKADCTENISPHIWLVFACLSLNIPFNCKRSFKYHDAWNRSRSFTLSFKQRHETLIVDDNIWC